MMTKYNQNSIFLIDFGLTSLKKDVKKFKFRGTPFYASNNALLRHTPGAKDDVESLLYILIYFLRGNLPWSRDLPVLKDDVFSNLEI